MSKKIADIFKLTHISMNSLLNGYVAENPGEEESLAIKRALSSGELPEDQIMNALFSARASRKDAKELGMCVDGYPLTETQVAFLRETLGVEPSLVIMLECSDNFVISNAEYVDSLTGKSLTLEEAKTTQDPQLVKRIGQQVNENEEPLYASLEKWEMAKRTLSKAFEQKVVSFDIEKSSESQVIESIEFLLRTMF